MQKEQWLITSEFKYDIQVIEKGSFDAKVLKDGKVVKTFFGETAHMDANRLANDLFFQEQNREGNW